MTLDGKTIAILIAPSGTEDPEFAKPRDAVTQAGATVTVIGLAAGQAKTCHNDIDPGETYVADRTIDDVSAADYDGLIVPGGCVGADKLRASPKAVAFIRSFVEHGKPVAVICHAPWTLIEAGVVRGRTLTSYPTLQTDIRNAGGTWVDQQVCVDGTLVTSRNPKDLPAFCAQFIAQFA